MLNEPSVSGVQQDKCRGFGRWSLDGIVVGTGSMGSMASFCNAVILSLSVINSALKLKLQYLESERFTAWKQALRPHLSRPPFF